MKKFGQLWLAALMVTLLLVGCSNDAETAVDNTPAAVEQTEQAELFPVTLTDALGNEVTLQQAPEQIISLIPSNTEILFALGLDKEIVGVSELDNYPDAATTKEIVGGMTFNLEKMISLQPDIIFAHESGMYALGDSISQLEAVGIPVFVVKDAVDFDETYKTIEEIGQLTGKVAEAAAVIAETKAGIEQVVAKLEGVESKSAFIVVGTDPDIYVAGKGTFIDAMLQAIGVENAVQQEDWPIYSAEQFVASNSNTILVTYESDIAGILENPAYAVMEAVKNNHVKLIDGDTTSRQGPRLADGIESIAKAMYPEAFVE